ncbi:MAG: hypothetical protein V1767_09410 [Chloroflexota bacterium]
MDWGNLVIGFLPLIFFGALLLYLFRKAGGGTQKVYGTVNKETESINRLADAVNRLADVIAKKY